MAGSNDGEQGQQADSSTVRSQRGRSASALADSTRPLLHSCVAHFLSLLQKKAGKASTTAQGTQTTRDECAGAERGSERIAPHDEQRSDSMSAKRILAAAGGIPLGLLRNSIRHRALVQLALHDAAHGYAGDAAVCTAVMRCDAFGCRMLRPRVRCGLRIRPG